MDPLRGPGRPLRNPSRQATRTVSEFLLGGADVILKKPNLLAKIRVQLLLGGAEIILEKQDLSARIGVKLSDFEEGKPESQDWNKVVVAVPTLS